MKFKIGDKVVCVDNGDSDDILILDKEYTVLGYSTVGEVLVGGGIKSELGWSEYRFQKVKNKTEGGSTPSQYRLSINLPLTSNREEFVNVDVEAMDIIDALSLSGNMKDVLKAMWRMGKKENTTTEYDFNKMVFFILREQYRQGIITHKQFWQKVRALGLGEV